MARIKEVSDGGSEPNTPTITEMRQSQQAGSKSTGTQSDDYGTMEADFNMGTGKASKQKDTAVNNANGYDPWSGE